jgi:hypothetical protein
MPYVLKTNGLTVNSKVERIYEAFYTGWQESFIVLKCSAAGGQTACAVTLVLDITFFYKI